MSDKMLRRLPLRQLLTSADKSTRELEEMIHTDFLPRVIDFRDLTRPVRRKSAYPTVNSLQNGLKRFSDANDKLNTMIEVLLEHLDAIRDHANREKLNRKK
ncbi:MAG: hypothetical protein EXS16_13885 [Gemmataceae bacterium]|nr:hypothetical protein [Gemmataceae bacterium]